MAATSLDHARHALLALHKSIIDAGRAEIEQREGRKVAPAEMLQLLVGDARFAWLSAMTTLIVRLDEAMEPDAEESVETVVAFALDLLTPDNKPSANTFRTAYAEQLQSSPAVVLAHRAATSALRAIQ
jgi:hypothetical protein